MNGFVLVMTLLSSVWTLQNTKKTPVMTDGHTKTSQDSVVAVIIVAWPDGIISTRVRGTAAAVPSPFRLGNPAVCGSHRLVSPY